MPATFATLASSVQKDLNRDLTELDLAAIKVVVPDDVFFDYVDPVQLELTAEPMSIETPKSSDIYGRSSSAGPIHPEEPVLIFEFIDGMVKIDPKKVTKDHMTPPPYSSSNMVKLVQKRLAKFRKALDHCCLNIDQIYDEAKKLIPTPPIYVDRVEAMIQQGSVLRNHVNDRGINLDEFVSKLQDAEDYKNQIVENGIIKLAPMDAKLVTIDPLEEDITMIDEELAEALFQERGIDSLFSHQRSALAALSGGKHVVVTTSTSSGKSLIFMVPTLHSLKNDRKSSALYIYPTKALSQDQRSSLQKMLLALGLTDVVADTYDGDTPFETRRELRGRASVIFTNPDMVHMSIIQHCQLWAPFLSHLKYLVVDELHYYSGCLGAHMALIMRRLLRVCHLMGNDTVQIISCSATINDPLDLMSSIFSKRSITNENTVVISEDGSARAARTLVMWETPYVSPKDPTSGRMSIVNEAARLLIDMVTKNIRAIAFCKYRRTCELVMKTIINILREDGNMELANQIMTYRGGYNQEDRRKIEHQMFTGGLSAIIATNALELGIDIGNLDAVLVVGFPFSISAFRQQIGRAGRRNQDALAILVGGGDPIDQYFMQNPQAILALPHVNVAVSLANELIVASHIQCAGVEWPLSDDDSSWFDLTPETSVWTHIVLEGMSLNEDGTYTCTGCPFDGLNIRGSAEDMYAVVEITGGRTPTVIETMEHSRVPFSLYEGGIFLHKGVPYLIQEVNVLDRYAKVTRVDVDWTTRQRDFTDIDPVKCHDTVSISSNDKYHVHLGDIRHKVVVFGFFKFDRKNRILDAVEVDSPPIQFDTYGFWINVPQVCLDLLNEKKLSIAGGIHGAEHAILSLLPFIVTSSPGDVITECKAPQKEFAHKQTQRKRPARLIFCDKKGSGISKRAFPHIANIFPRALDRVAKCPCLYGCPECIASTSCKENSEVLSKIATHVILAELSGNPLQPDKIPEGPEPNLGKIHVETVIAAHPEAFRRGASVKQETPVV